MRSLFLPRAIPLSAAAMLATFTALPASAQTVLTVSSWVPTTHMLHETVKDWCANLEQKTTGQVKCNILPRAVSAPPGSFDAVRNGLADISYTSHGYTPGRFTATRMAEFPFVANSSESLSVAYQRIAEKTPAIQEEHRGVKILTVFTHGPGMVFNTKRPIVKVEDLAGLKFRIGGGMVNELSKALNMNVTLKPSVESYELISTGVMDGTLFPAESVEAFKIDKIVRYGTSFPGGLYNSSFVFMMNPAAYDKLPPAGKKAVDELSGEAAARVFGRGWDKADRRGLAMMQASGVQMTRADAAFVKAIGERVAPLEKDWATQLEAKGMKEPLKVLAKLRADAAALEK